MSSLQKPKKQKGWALPDIAVKCRTLLLRRMWVQSQKSGTVTAMWFAAWNFVGPQVNLSNVGNIH
jgi:hypothetical protein